MIIPYGEGKIIVSTLELVDNFSKDPVADKIFYNLISYAKSQIGEISAQNNEEIELKLKKYLKKFEDLKHQSNSKEHHPKPKIIL